MTGRLIAIDELSERDLNAWRELAIAALEPNPFFEPEFVLPAADAIPARGLGLLVSERAGSWTALTPVHRVRRWHRVPVPGLVTWSHSYSFLGTPLVIPAHSEASLAALCRAGIEAAPSAGLFGLDTIRRDGPVAEALRTGLSATRLHTTELTRSQRAMLNRRDDGDYLQMSPKHRRELRRKRDRLGERLGGRPELGDESDRPASVRDFLRLEASGWKGRAGTALASRESHARLLTAVCNSFARLGRLQLLALRAGDGPPLAMMCNLRAGEAVFAFKIAFDEDLSRFSPGIMLIADQVELFHRTPELMWVDSCADPDNEMINRLWVDRRELATIAITRPVAASLSRAALRAASRIREAQKGRR